MNISVIYLSREAAAQISSISRSAVKFLTREAETVKRET
jgi:hypothetical protein